MHIYALYSCVELNPATLLPTTEDSEPHDCATEIRAAVFPRPDLNDTALHEPDLEFFVDGSCLNRRHYRHRLCSSYTY